MQHTARAMRDSLFCVVPAGDTLTSRRLFDARIDPAVRISRTSCSVIAARGGARLAVNIAEIVRVRAGVGVEARVLAASLLEGSLL